jgi:gliding motility-associated protein GldM
MASPVSRVIAAGTKYEARVFMTATSSTLQPQMQLAGNSVNVDESGVGKISFIASGGNYIDGSMKKTWSGKITMKQPSGKDTTYIIEEDYIVTKPVIQVQAAAVQALYRNCGNKLNIQVPALGNAYNPKITSDGATITQGSNRGLVTVVPTGPSVNLKVNSDGNYIGEERFRVKLIPLPTIEVKVNGKKVDPLIGADLMTLRNISVKAIPDKDFAEFLPDDAVYKITEWKIILARGRNSPVSPKSCGTEQVSIADIASNAKQNDRLIVEILKVKRKNFRGEWEEVNIPSSVHVIPIN